MKKTTSHKIYLAEQLAGVRNKWVESAPNYSVVVCTCGMGSHSLLTYLDNLRHYIDLILSRGEIHYDDTTITGLMARY